MTNSHNPKRSLRARRALLLCGLLLSGGLGACSESTRLIDIQTGTMGMVLTWVGAEGPTSFHVYRDGERIGHPTGALCLQDPCVWLDRGHDLFLAPSGIEATEQESGVLVRWSDEPTLRTFRYEIAPIIGEGEGPRSAPMVGVLATWPEGAEVMVISEGKETVEAQRDKAPEVYLSGSPFRMDLKIGHPTVGRRRIQLSVQSQMFSVRVAQRLVRHENKYEPAPPVWSPWSPPVEVSIVGRALKWDVRVVKWDGPTGQYNGDRALEVKCPMTLEAESVTCDIELPEREHETLQVEVQLDGTNKISRRATFPFGTTYIN